jgi:hypothetical protein
MPALAVAQSSLSPVVTIGMGSTPARSIFGERLHGAGAATIAVFRPAHGATALGLEAGYQRYGSSTVETQYDGWCPIFPGGKCLGTIDARHWSRGAFWYVGPTLRLRISHDSSIRPVGFLGMALYGSAEHTDNEYHDARGAPAFGSPARITYSFRGIGLNAGIGIEGTGVGRGLRWTVIGRVHGAVGGIGGEGASRSTYTVTAGLTMDR